MSMTTHLGHMLELRQHIIECREEMSDRTFINALFMSFPQSPEWRTLRNTLYCKGTLLILNNVITELNAEFDQMVQDRAVEDRSKKAASDQMALLANGTGQKGGGLSSKKGKGKGKKKGPKPDDVCHGCRGLGHWRNQPVCLKQLGECEVGKVLMAVDCGATTHMFTEKVYFESLKSKELVTVGGHNRVPRSHFE